MPFAVEWRTEYPGLWAAEIDIEPYSHSAASFDPALSATLHSFYFGTITWYNDNIVGADRN